jgi:hypothetical protein
MGGNMFDILVLGSVASVMAALVRAALVKIVSEPEPFTEDYKRGRVPHMEV